MNEKRRRRGEHAEQSGKLEAISSNSMERKAGHTANQTKLKICFSWNQFNKKIKSHGINFSPGLQSTDDPFSTIPTVVTWKEIIS